MRLYKTVAVLLIAVLSPSVMAVAPGGVYSNTVSISLSIDSGFYPSTLGYHVISGTAVYHGRKMVFYSGVFLPPAFFHAGKPMPVLMGLHNRYAIGQNPAALGYEGLGQMLAIGHPDTRAEGDTPAKPIDLRQDAPFIGLIPLCPSNCNWEDPGMATLLCRLIDLVVAHYHADDDRVYLTGFSYGASSTWRVAMNAPDKFAAIIVCDGRATPDPDHDVQKLKDMPVYLEVGQWDGDFVTAADRMHQALNSLPHRNYIFHQIPGGNHFNYQSVYNDPDVWKWVLAQKRGEMKSEARNQNSE